MCSLETAPWRANFTGKKCRCGVPMPGNEEEKRIDKEMKAKREEIDKPKRLAEHKVQLEAYRTKRIAEMLKKRGL